MKMKKIILIIFLYIFCIYNPTFAEEVWTGVYITINDDPWINNNTLIFNYKFMEKKEIKQQELKILQESCLLKEILKDNDFLKEHIEEIKQQIYFLMK